MKYYYDTIKRIDTMFTENATRAIFDRIEKRSYYPEPPRGSTCKYMKFKKDFNRCVRDPTAYIKLRKHVRMMMTMIDDL